MKQQDFYIVANKESKINFDCAYCVSVLIGVVPTTD